MSSPEVLTVSLDGLNNNGKTTQSRYIKKELEARDIPAVIRPGDGARKGQGLNESDPVSEWWQENYPRIVAEGTKSEGSSHIASIVYRRLCQELYILKNKDFLSQLEFNDYDKGVIILDRGPISRLFVARRYDPDISFNSALGIDEDPELASVLPDEIIVLHAPKEVLLQRNEIREEGGREKIEFNKHILESYYDDFERTIENLPPELDERTSILESTKPIRTVGKIALSKVLNLYYER